MSPAGCRHTALLSLSHHPAVSYKAESAGGELQRFAIAVVAAQKADVYMIDEPSSYLDVRQRLKAAQVHSWLSFRLAMPARFSKDTEYFGKAACEDYKEARKHLSVFFCLEKPLWI